MSFFSDLLGGERPSSGGYPSGGGRPSKGFRVAAAGIIAALYVGLSLISALLGLSSGLVQLRLSEALYVLALFTPAAIPGLFVGCFLANVLTGCVMLDVVVGSLATLVGAAGTWAVETWSVGRCAGQRGRAAESARAFSAWRLALSLLPPIIVNTFALPIVFTYGYGIAGSYLMFAGFIFAGELLSCGVLGFMLGRVIKKKSPV